MCHVHVSVLVWVFVNSCFIWKFSAINLLFFLSVWLQPCLPYSEPWQYYNKVINKFKTKSIYFWFFQKPILEPPFIESYQRVCTYNETRLETVKLPNCQPNVDPTYTYPVALRCDCGVCLTSTTECITSVWSLNRQKYFMYTFGNNYTRYCFNWNVSLRQEMLLECS